MKSRSFSGQLCLLSQHGEPFIKKKKKKREKIPCDALALIKPNANQSSDGARCRRFWLSVEIKVQLTFLREQSVADEARTRGSRFAIRVETHIARRCRKLHVAFVYTRGFSDMHTLEYRVRIYILSLSLLLSHSPFLISLSQYAAAEKYSFIFRCLPAAERNSSAISLGNTQFLYLISFLCAKGIFNPTRHSARNSAHVNRAAAPACAQRGFNSAAASVSNDSFQLAQRMRRFPLVSVLQQQEERPLTISSYMRSRSADSN